MGLSLVASELGAPLFGTAVWLVAASMMGRSALTTRISETRAWWRLVTPLFGGVLILSFVTGWALQEPDPPDEVVELRLCLLGMLVGIVVLRALVRAVRSVLTARRRVGPVATIGLFRCRTVVSSDFARAASREAIEAALAHEAAHAKNYDPIRIWAAQFAADLQWPVPRAQRRFQQWLLALELQRDDDAIAAGASATGLAEAILVAAKLRTGAGQFLGAEITGQGEGLVLRVRKLLGHPGHSAEPTTNSWRPWALALTTIAIAIALGDVYGDSILLFIPGVGR